jgi:hypothetical protein
VDVGAVKRHRPRSSRARARGRWESAVRHRRLSVACVPR